MPVFRTAGGSNPEATTDFDYQQNPAMIDQSITTLLLTNPTDDHVEESDLSTHSHSENDKNSISSSILSFVCTTVGAGILSLPSSLALTGWIGILIIAITAIVCNHTAKYLIACMFVNPEQRLKTYEDIGKAALGPHGRTLVAVFQTVTLFGVCTIFLILIGINMNALIPSVTLHVWVFIFGTCLIPVAWLKTMKEVAPLAYFGIAASLIVAIIIVIRGSYESISSNRLEEALPVEHTGANWSNISSGFNVIVFSFGGHSVIPNIVNEMKHAEANYKQFSFGSFSFIGCVYIIVAATGYAGYGNGVAGNVLESIDATGVAAAVHHLVQFARVIITIHVFLAYPLPLNPACLYIEEVTGIDKLIGKKELLSRIILRTCLVLFTVFIASVVPYFDNVLSLVSALSMIAVAFIFPPWFYYLLFRNKRKIDLKEKIIMASIIIFGIVSTIAGLYYSIKGLSDEIKKNPSPFDGFFKQD